jgi:hypothetical protein
MKVLFLCLIGLGGAFLCADELKPMLIEGKADPVVVKPSAMSDEKFIDASRKALISTSWIKMSGNLNTRPKQGKRARYPLTIAAEIRPQKLVFKTTINKTQSVKVQHTYGDEHETKVLETTVKEGGLYQKLMIKPQDLSLSFMYWDMIKEYKSESLGITRIKCRVFLMANPDSTEYAKVWISEKYLGPVKVMWCREKIDFDKPQQILEFEGFTEKNKVWMPTDIYIKNGFGEMQIKLKEHDAAFSLTSPSDLFTTK